MTLLESVWNEQGTEAAVVEATIAKLESTELVLTGNFKNDEARIAKTARLE